MKLFGISRNAMVAGLVGAGAMGAILLGPQFPNADANPITLEAPNGARSHRDSTIGSRTD